MTTVPFDLSRRNIVRNVATLFSGSAVAQGMTALALLLTARQLGAGSYGQYAACFALAGLSSIVFSLGLDIWLLSEGGRYPQQVAELTGGVLMVKITVGLVWFGLAAALATWLHQESFPADVFRWSAILVWLDSLLATLLTAFKAALRNQIPSILEAVADVIWFLATLVLIWLGNRQPEAYLQIRVWITIPALLLAGYLCWRTIGLKGALVTAQRALRTSLPFAASEFLAWTSMRVDVIIVGFTLGEYASGVYSPAVGLVNMVFWVPMAVYTVMVPVLSNHYEINLRQAKVTARRTILVSAVIGVGLTLLFLVGAPLVVAVLGESYQDTLGIMRILSGVLLFKCVSFGMAAIIVSTGKQARRPIVQVVAAVTNIILNLMVVFWVGIQGVAAVYVLTEIIILVGYTWIVWRKR